MNFFISTTALVVTEVTDDDIGRLVSIELEILRRVGFLAVGPRTSVQVWEFKEGRRADVEAVLAGFCVTPTPARGGEAPASTASTSAAPNATSGHVSERAFPRQHIAAIRQAREDYDKTDILFPSELIAAVDDFLADVDEGVPPPPLTVAAALDQGVIEFHFHDDWYQLKWMDGERHPAHRYRVDSHRGAGWSSWRQTSASNLRRWSDLPAQRVATADAERDPITRWGAIPTQEPTS